MGALRRLFIPGITRGGGTPWYKMSNPIAAYQPIGAASLAASYVNLANPGTYDATLGVAPNFDTAYGWGFTGTQYLKTAIIPTIDQTWSMLCRYSDLTVAVVTIVGCNNESSQQFRIGHHSSSGALVGNGNQNAFIAHMPNFTAGVYGFAGRYAYRNGLVEANTIPAGTQSTALRVWIGTSNVDNSTAPWRAPTVKIQAIGIWNKTLTTVEVMNISAAMAEL